MMALVPGSPKQFFSRTASDQKLGGLGLGTRLSVIAVQWPRLGAYLCNYTLHGMRIHLLTIDVHVHRVQVCPHSPRHDS